MKLRTFTVKPTLSGWTMGMMAGLSASDYAFDSGLAKVDVRRASPVTLDVEALRGDVGRAQRAVAGPFVTRSKLAEAG